MQSCPIVTPEILLPRLQTLIIITHYERPKIPLPIIISYPHHLHLDSEFVSSTQVLR